jgi:hypothetical protein
VPEPLDFELVGPVERVAEGGPRLPRPRRGVLLGAALVLVAVAGAWAAWALHAAHRPIAYSYGAPATADTRYGATVAGSVRLLADDVRDPDGGLPWGLRTFTTDRGFGCVQVGRVQDGRLGVLALVEPGGRVRARGLFHELRPAAADQATTCLPLDGAGHAFVALHMVTTTDATPAGCWFRSSGLAHLRCPPARTRTIDAGLLGPRAAALTARVGGRMRTLRPLGAAGGYLIVQRPVDPATMPQKLGDRTFALPLETPLALTPASKVVRRVAYRGAPACDVHPTTSPQGACPDPPGFTPIPQPPPAALRARVRAAVAPGGRALRVAFRAPVAAHDGVSAYRVMVRPPPGRCPGARACPGVVFGSALAREVPAGAAVSATIAMPVPRRGRFRVEVSYRVRGPRPGLTGGLGAGYAVGGATVTVR